MAISKGIYLSPGVYRNPTTGKTFQSTTGVIGAPKIPKQKTNVASSNQMGQTVQTQQTGQTAQGAGAWNEALSDEAKKLRQIQAAGKLKTGQQTRLDELMSIKANRNTPIAPTPTGQEQTAPTPTVATQPAGLSEDEMLKIAERLFPGRGAIDSERIEKDALFQDALKRGETVLNRRAAARGLTGSGAEIASYNDFLSNLSAKTAERISDIDQQEADRLYGIQRDESLRKERAENAYFDRNLSLAELMQRQDPTQEIMDVVASSTNLTVNQAKDLANFLRSNYAKVRAGGSGGGGFTPITASPYSSTNITPTGIANNLASSGGWTDTLSTLLSGLLK